MKCSSIVAAALLAALVPAGQAAAQFGGDFRGGSGGGPGGGPGAGAIAGVEMIRITNAKNVWLQVAEVVAIEQGTGANVASVNAGARAFAPNQYSPTAGPRNAIDGVQPLARSDSARPGIYHSGVEGAGAVLEIALARPANLTRLTIHGRTDCCAERDVYHYALIGRRGALLRVGTILADNREHAGSISFVLGGSGDEDRGPRRFDPQQRR